MIGFDYSQLDFSFSFDDDEVVSSKSTKKKKVAEAPRSDYCYACDTDQLYCHAMTFKCKFCNTIILGGEK